MTHAIRLPGPLSLPARIIPPTVHSAVITRLLNTLLSSQLKDDELDFLRGKILHVCVEDANMMFSMSVQDKRLIAGNTKKYDMKISGTVHDFLLLISRSEDADTLFFQRRLKMQGDTELGLYLKNFLDGMDVDSLPYYHLGNPLLVKGIRLFEQLFKYSPSVSAANHIR
ncbi:MAG: SCP2 sterol-binding domain-containing protein [Gammaproteobacteria bacterium]|nr:SCP2 sterol-binding domain-containing protein [Gammaproteobacteria bacterium]